MSQQLGLVFSCALASARTFEHEAGHDRRDRSFDLPQTAAPLNPTAGRLANGSATAEQKSEYLKQLAAVGF